ncbi:MAG: FAD-dependent monooxygenase [Hyphomicrobiales bacterium]|nr:FAD-dependent monooxygenase [Hyphomicrobiales bacterium]
MLDETTNCGRTNVSKPHVLIAGAGIGGLAAALALLQKGYDVDVYEQAPVLLEFGAGVQMAANGTRVLLHLGLKEALAPWICEAAGKEVRIWNTGQTFKLFDLGEDSVKRFGAPYWFVHRGDLHTALKNAVLALKADAIHTNARVAGYAQDGNRVALALADGRTISGDILVGADGVHSVLRQQMHDPSESEFLGIIAWRGLIDRSKLSPDLQRMVGTNWVGPGGHVITYPIHGGELLNFVGFGERDDWRVESWNEKGTREECAQDFVGWNPAVHEMISLIDQPYKWALVSRSPLQTWTKGRATLLGDACHPTVPFLAQGAIMALEDSVVLTRCLEKYSDVEEALMKYQDARVERTTRIVNGSTETGKRFHNRTLADPDAAVAFMKREWAPDKVRTRYDWLFEYDAMNVEV